VLAGDHLQLPPTVISEEAAHKVRHMSAHCLFTALLLSNDHVLYSLFSILVLCSLVCPSDNRVCLFEMAMRFWGLMALDCIKLARVAVQTSFFLDVSFRPLHLSSMQSLLMVMSASSAILLKKASPEQALLRESSVHYISSIMATLVYVPPVQQLLVDCASHTDYGFTTHDNHGRWSINMFAA